MYTFCHDTPLGTIRASADDHKLQGLWFTGQKYFPKDVEIWTEMPDYPCFVSLASWLGDYFSGKKPDGKLAILPKGTVFQQAVWKILLKIPYGKTTTYGDIAKKLNAEGIKASAKAVGGAVGRNPISLVIPCHRVVGSDGSLTGYAGGIEKKLALLELEGAI